MLFLYDNLNWMLFNLALALVPIILVFLLRKKFPPFVRAALYLLWLLFLPNTVYLVTDIEYLPYQILRAGMFEQGLLFLQYAALAGFGVFSYLYSLEPIGEILKKYKIKGGSTNAIYITLNTLVGFGIVMGKVQRTHSWYVFTDPQRVVRDAVATASVSDLLFWVFFCAVVINGFFFVFRNYFPAVVLRKKKKK